MNRILIALVCATGVAAAQGPAAEQTAAAEHFKVPFRDPSRPGTVRVNLVRGSIAVRGYEGREVLIEMLKQPSGASKPNPDAGGMRRVFEARSGLTVEEEDNVMKVSATSGARADLRIQVPMKTSLKLNSVHGGMISVENVDGDLEVSNIHGSVTLAGVSGSVVAHALHGNIKAAIARVDAAKPMSFSSLHGNIDLTLPASTKADLKMRTDRGEAYSDFDVILGPSTAKVEDERKDGKGKYRIAFGTQVTGQINGGGQEIALKTVHGNLYIRKGK